MTDPWSVQKSDIATEEEKSINNGDENGESDLGEPTKSLGFEDSFITDNNSNKGEDNNYTAVIENNSNSSLAEHQPLPDSQTYLKGLGKI